MEMAGLSKAPPHRGDPGEALSGVAMCRYIFFFWTGGGGWGITMLNNEGNGLEWRTCLRRIENRRWERNVMSSTEKGEP